MEANLDLSTYSLNKNPITETNVENEETVETLIDDHKKNNQTKTCIPNSLKGSLLMIIAVFLICLYAILVKLSFTINPSEHTFVRYAIQAIVMLIICKCKGYSIFGDKKYRKTISVLGIINVIIVYSTFIAVRLIHASDFVTIGNSTVIITAVLCRIFLKEKLTIVHLIAFLLTLVGIICICRPTFIFQNKTLNVFDNMTMNNSGNLTEFYSSIQTKKQYYQYIGVALAVICAFSMGLGSVLFKRVVNANIHFSVIHLYSVYFGLPISFAASLVLYFTGHSHQNIDEEKQYYLFHILYSLGAAFSGVVGIIILTIAFKYDDATRLTVVKTVDVVFSFVLQYFLLNAKIDLLGLIGAVFVLSSTFLIVSFKIFETNFKKIKACKCFIYKF